MDKYTIANYLVNLNALLAAQESTGLEKSSILAEEYNRQWGLLKEAIENDKSTKTESSPQPMRRI